MIRTSRSTRTYIPSLKVNRFAAHQESASTVQSRFSVISITSVSVSHHKNVTKPLIRSFATAGTIAKETKRIEIGHGRKHLSWEAESKRQHDIRTARAKRQAENEALYNKGEKVEIDKFKGEFAFPRGQLLTVDKLPAKIQELAFAVVHVGGHQFKVSPGDVILTQKLPAEVGRYVFNSSLVKESTQFVPFLKHLQSVAKLDQRTLTLCREIILDKVLLIGTRSWTAIGTPLLTANVRATVEEQTRTEKVINFKKKRRKNYRRTKGHKQHITTLRIGDIHFSYEDFIAQVKNAKESLSNEPANETATEASPQTPPPASTSSAKTEEATA